MNYKTNPLLLIIIVLIFSFGCKQKSEDYKKVLGAQQWEYFGQNMPGNLPELFSPNMISTSKNERDFAITTHGKEMYFTKMYPNGKKGVILFMHFDGYFWAEPEVAPFSGQYSDLEPALSPDGQKLFFASNRPMGISDSVSDDYNIWYVERLEGRWSAPKDAGSEINSSKNEYFPSVSNDGTLFFTSDREDSMGKEDIYFSEYVNGKYTKPINIGEPINSENYEFNAFVAPDKSYLLFSSIGREDGLGGGDIYISKPVNDSTWSKPQNLGSQINSPYLDYCPCVSPDGKYLFFTSNRINSTLEKNSGKNFKTLKKLFNGIENGLGNIYWVEFSVVL